MPSPTPRLLLSTIDVYKRQTVDIELVHQARMHAVYHPTTEPAKRGFRALLDFAGYMDGKERCV